MPMLTPMPSHQIKECPQCRWPLPLWHFNRYAELGQCDACGSGATGRLHRPVSPGRPRADSPALPGGMKRCAHCGAVKRFAEFGHDSRMSTGRQSYCRGCRNEYQYLRPRPASQPRLKDEFREWVGLRTREQAWLECERLDWLQDWVKAHAKRMRTEALAPIRRQYAAALKAAKRAFREATWPARCALKTSTSGADEALRTYDEAIACDQRAYDETVGRLERILRKTEAPIRRAYKDTLTEVMRALTCEELRSTFERPTT